MTATGAGAREGDILDRMEKLCRRMAGNWSLAENGDSFTNIAQRLVAELDRVRDPDIVLAERIASSHCGANVDAVLNGIKMGRELATNPQPDGGNG